MKFIRDIIAEKTNTLDAEGRQLPKGDIADPTVAGTAELLSEGIDSVHMVASGATSLGKENHFAFQAESDPDDPHDDKDFDLLSDEDETDDPADDGQNPLTEDGDASELFADIWTDDPGTEEDAEIDVFGVEPIEPDVMEMLDTTPEQTAPQTKAEVLMQTMYPQDPTPTADPMPEEPPQSAPQETVATVDEDIAEPEVETNNTSAFHKILRRRDESPTETQPTPEAEPAEQTAEPRVKPISVPAPAAGRARRQAGRVKTRLLGFGNDAGGEKDLFAADGAAVQPTQAKFPVGWMVIVSGPGRGTAFTLFNGVSQIGRGEDQAVRLDFGDSSISRSNHAAVAYDPEQQEFFLGHGGKANLVRLNGSPVLSTEPLKNGALIRLGETTLRFVGLCGDEFDWGNTQEGEG